MTYQYEWAKEYVEIYKLFSQEIGDSTGAALYNLAKAIIADAEKETSDG